MTTYRLVARDAATFRRQHVDLGTGWDPDFATTNPDTVGTYIANLAVALAQRWPHHYRTPCPLKRLDWTIERSDQ